MNDWLRVTAIGGDDYECRMTVRKADDTTITVTRPWHHHWTDGWDWKTIILHCLEERSTLFVVLSGVFTGLGIFIVFLGTVAVLMLTQPTKTVDENVPRPASFVTQVGREFGVRNLSCPAKVMTASELPDMGSYHCVYTYGANDANLRNVTLVVADGNKVGLYKADGKALKPVGKD